MSERHGAAGLWLRRSRVDAAVLALLAAVAAASAALLTAAPLALASVATAELQATVAGFDASRRDLTGTAPFTPAADPGSLLTAIQASLDAARFPSPLNDLLAAPQWAVTAEEQGVDVGGATDNAIRVVQLTTSPDWVSRVTFTSGSAPGAATGADASAPSALPDAEASVPVAVSEAMAGRFGVAVGDVLPSSPVPLTIAGVYRTYDPGEPFWGHLPTAVEAAERRAADGRVIVSAAVFVDPGSLAALRDVFASASVGFWWPLDVGGLTFDRAGAVAGEIRAVGASPPGFPTVDTAAGGIRSPSDVVVMNVALAGDLQTVIDRFGTASVVFALVGTGPIGVMLAVLALVARALLDRRRPAFALARARGARASALAIGLTAEAALVTVPSAALGVGLAMLVLGPKGMVLWPAIVVAVAVPVLVAADAAVRHSVVTRLRWVAETLVAGLAAVAVYLMVSRRPATGGGVDPLLAATPLLVAAAVTVGVLQLYPVVLRTAGRAAHRRVGPVAVVGAARAVRAPALGVAGVFALVVGVSISTFSAGVGTTVVAALAAPATVRDATFDADHPLAALLLAVLALGVAVPLASCAAAVAIAAVAAARSRGSAVALLRSLGFSPGQVRGLIRWELAPIAVAAGAAGTVLGLVEAVVLGAALDLPSLLDRPAPIALNPAVVGVVLGVFTAAVALAATAATAGARRGAGPARMVSE